MSKGKKNAYVCNKCKKFIITIDVDDGVTPFMIECKATKNCDGSMCSNFYSIDQSMPAQFEWFTPKSSEGYGMEEKTHFLGGGLDIREIRH